MQQKNYDCPVILSKCILVLLNTQTSNSSKEGKITGMSRCCYSRNHYERGQTKHQARDPLSHLAPLALSHQIDAFVLFIRMQLLTTQCSPPPNLFSSVQPLTLGITVKLNYKLWERIYTVMPSVLNHTDVHWLAGMHKHTHTHTRVHTHTHTHIQRGLE